MDTFFGQIDIFYEYDDPLMPKYCSELLFWLSFLLLFTAAYAFIKKNYDTFVICILIFITSLNFWRDPKFGFRRNIDMVVVCLGFIYVLVRAIILKVKSPLFWTSCIAIMLLFPTSLILHENEHIVLSTFAHGCLHLCGNVLVILLCGV